MSRLTLILIVGLFISLLMLAISQQNNKNMSRDFRSLQDLNSKTEQQAKYWKDKDGKHHAQLKVAQASLAAVTSMYGDELKNLSKEVSGLKKNLKNLESFTTLGLSNSGNVSTTLLDTIIMRDTVKVHAKQFFYSDKWTPHIKGIVTDKNIDIEYKFRDSLTFVTYWDKKGFFIFKKPVLKLDVISYNPNSTIEGIKNVQITTPKRRKPRIGFYAGCGLGLGTSGLSPQVGVGLVY